MENVKSRSTAVTERQEEKGTSWALVFVAVVLPLAWLSLWRTDPVIYREHGPMEMFQVAALVVGLFLSYINTKISPRIGDKVVYLGLGLLFLTFILLEFDTRSFNSPLLIRLTNGKIRNLWLGFLWGGVAILAIWRLRNVLEAGWKWLRSRPGTFMMISGVFWVAGWAVDKWKPSNAGVALMTEELLEVNAAYFMLISAALSFLQVRGKRRINGSDVID
ncbi:MAG: hypothetical protein ACK4UN_20610 [Limisphaerales bacterium]